MVIAFQILLLIMMFISFVISLSKDYDSKTKMNSGIMCLATITAFIFTITWF